MKCLNCKQPMTSGYLWFGAGESYITYGIDDKTYKFIPITSHKIERIFGFCSEKCQQRFFLDKRWFDKHQIPLRRRLKSRLQVALSFQSAMLKTDNGDTKGLLHVLSESI